MQINSKQEWITPGTLPLDDSVLRDKIYQRTGYKYAYSPSTNINLNWVDQSALSSPCSSGTSHCTVGSGGPLSVRDQLDLLYRLNSKAFEDPPALDNLDSDTVLRQKIYRIIGNKYAYAPTPHNSFSCVDYSIETEHMCMDNSALSAPCSTGSSHCTAGSGDPLSDLDQWEPFISVNSKAFEDLLAMEEDLAPANSVTADTATSLAPVTFDLCIASGFPFDHFLISANEWPDMKNYWKPIFTTDSPVREMDEVEKWSTLVLTPAVSLTTIHLCVALPDCTLSVLLTRLRGNFRATGKLHFRAGGQKQASQIMAWIHQLRGNTFAFSATAHNNSITWLNYSSQHAPNYILNGHQGDGSSVERLSGSYRVDSPSILILTRLVQLTISHMTSALQVCNLSGWFPKHYGNIMPVGQLLKAKALSYILSSMTSLRYISGIPSCRTRKALQLGSATASINIPAHLSVDNTGQQANKTNTALFVAENSMLPVNNCISNKEELTNPHSRAVSTVDVDKEAPPEDENIPPQYHVSSNEHGIISSYATALLPSTQKKKKAPTGCFKWLWRLKKKTALPVDDKDLTQNHASSNEHGLIRSNASVLPSANKKAPSGCFRWLWRSK